MKLLKQLMKSIGGGRRKSGNTSASASRKRRANSMKESSTSATEDLSNRSLASVCSSSEAPWRVERIRVAAPGEADWWKEEEVPQDVTTDDTWISGESMDESIEKEDGKKSLSSNDSSSSAKKFHNCGLETWEAARAAWTARPDVRSSSPKPVTPVSKKELGKILTKASSLRTYELPRRTPLKNLIESYVMVWNGSDD